MKAPGRRTLIAGLAASGGGLLTRALPAFAQDYPAKPVSVRGDPLRARLIELGYVPIGSGPQDFRARIESDIAKWSRIIEAGNIKPN